VVTLVSSITGATVYVVGTAHVSRASVVDVCEVIRFTKPNLVFLELCRSRLPLLLTPESDSSGPPLTLAQTLKKMHLLLEFFLLYWHIFIVVLKIS